VLKRAALTCAVSVVIACGGRVALAPSLFPMLQVWTAPLDDHVQPPLASDGRLLFVSTRDGTLRAIDLLNGALRWRVGGRPGILAARKGLLVARDDDGTVWGLDPETGSARWKVESGVTGTLPPVFDGDRVVVAGKGLAVLDPVRGAVLWSVPSDAVASAPPVPSGRCLLVPEESGTLRCREPGTGNSVWTWNAGGPLYASPVVDDDGRILLGTSSRAFVSLSLADGRRRWRWKLGADVRARPALLGDDVVFASHEAVIYALQRSGGNLSWRATLPSRPLAPPVLLGEGVIVTCYGSRPSENLLLGFDGRNGRRLGELRTPAEIEGEPLLQGDRLLLPLRDRRILALQLAAPSDSDTLPPAPAEP
jgi:outer membrane protein assembly factor BamB